MSINSKSEIFLTISQFYSLTIFLVQKNIMLNCVIDTILKSVVKCSSFLYSPPCDRLLWVCSHHIIFLAKVQWRNDECYIHIHFKKFTCMIRTNWTCRCNRSLWAERLTWEIIRYIVKLIIAIPLNNTIVIKHVAINVQMAENVSSKSSSPWSR